MPFPKPVVAHEDRHMRQLTERVVEAVNANAIKRFEAERRIQARTSVGTVIVAAIVARAQQKVVEIQGEAVADAIEKK